MLIKTVSAAEISIGRGGLFMPAGTCHPENHGRGGSIYAGRHLPPGKIIAATILFMPAGTCHQEKT